MAFSERKPEAIPSPSASSFTSQPRRNFFAAAMAIVIGAIVMVFPLAAGLLPFFDPLRRKTAGRRVRVASLEAVPDDGVPHPFAIVADVVDAWTLLPDEPIGRVYLLRKNGEKTVEALSATCPHLGCMVGYDAAQKLFRCPCHTSAFDVDGKRRLDISKVPPRNMDRLECTVDEKGEIWVDYVNFKTGLDKPIPRA
jgi:menaquinol-cytochrome c reductase iron-sulfur subunit